MARLLAKESDRRLAGAEALLAQCVNDCARAHDMLVRAEEAIQRPGPELAEDDIAW